MISDNPLDNLDFSSSEFQAGVESLADRLKVYFLLFSVISHQVILDSEAPRPQDYPSRYLQICLQQVEPKISARPQLCDTQGRTIPF